MSPLIHQETQTYRKILALLFILAVVTVGGCLGLLWLRQKIEVTAQATRLLETDIFKEERRLRYIDTKIAEIHQPVYLERQIARLGLALQAPREDQIIYLQWYAPLANRLEAEAEARPATPRRDPYRHSIDLAVMDSLIPLD